jgi:hypothetical protein
VLRQHLEHVLAAQGLRNACSASWRGDMRRCGLPWALQSHEKLKMLVKLPVNVTLQGSAAP